MELTLQEKLKLINFFEFLLDEEISKPLGEMNSEAVDNYIEILLHLQDKHVGLSPEFISEQVRKIFREEENTVVPEAVKTIKKYFNNKKVWIVAACIAILVALFSVISFSSERSVKDILEEYLGSYEFISFGDEVDVGNESYIKIGESKVYKSINDLAENEKTNILYPKSTKACVQFIAVYETEGKKTMDISHTNSDLFVTITLNSEIPKEIIDVCNDKLTLNGIDYYLCIMEDANQAQAFFIHNNNFYDITYTDKDALIVILKNMEEIRYED